MSVDSLLESARLFYPEDFYSLLSHLSKCSNQLKLSSPENHLPLLIFKPKEIYLWIKDTGVSDYPFLFTDPDEILFILCQFLSTGDFVYISKDLPLQFSKAFIEKQIEECLLSDDKKRFSYWTKILKNGF